MGRLVGILGEFNHDDTTPPHDWVGISDALIKLHLCKHGSLAMESITPIQASFPDGPRKLDPLQLRKADALLFSDLSPSPLLIEHGASDDAEKLIGRLKRASICKRAVTTDTTSPLRRSPELKGPPNSGYLQSSKFPDGRSYRNSRLVVISAQRRMTYPHMHTQMFPHPLGKSPLLQLLRSTWGTALPSMGEGSS